MAGGISRFIAPAGATVISRGEDLYQVEKDGTVLLPYSFGLEHGYALADTPAPGGNRGGGGAKDAVPPAGKPIPTLEEFVKAGYAAKNFPKFVAKRVAELKKAGLDDAAIAACLASAGVDAAGQPVDPAKA